MSASYNPSLAVDKDWVRFRIGDTDTGGTNAQLQDEEIESLLATEPNRWFAAAVALSILHSKYALSGKGVMEKQVSRLKIKRGIGESASAAIKAMIAELRAKGSFELSPTPRIFRSL